MVNVNQEQVIFKRIAVSERKLIFREMSQDRVEISLKGEDDSIFHLKAMQVDKDESLLCHHTMDSKDQEKPQKIVGNFAFKNERYFFQSDLSFVSGWAVINITDIDLFSLQRRANARVDIPKDYPASFTLIVVNNKSVLVDCDVKDISAGGLKIEIRKLTPELSTGEIVKGVLRLGNRRPMEFFVEVRHTMKKESTQLTGVKFSGVDQMMENRLLSLMMDLQRELFLKYPTKS